MIKPSSVLLICSTVNDIENKYGCDQPRSHISRDPCCPQLRPLGPISQVTLNATMAIPAISQQESLGAAGQIRGKGLGLLDAHAKLHILVINALAQCVLWELLG